MTVARGPDKRLVRLAAGRRQTAIVRPTATQFTVCSSASIFAIYSFARSNSAMSGLSVMVSEKCLRAGTSGSTAPEACALLV